MTARILVICSGNVCRSPVAAAMLDAGLDDVEVTGRGTLAQPGQPMSGIMADLLRDRAHLEPPAAGAQRLTPSDVQRANRAKRPVPAELDDIDDPMGLDRQYYEAAFERIQADVERIVEALGRRG